MNRDLLFWLLCSFFIYIPILIGLLYWLITAICKNWKVIFRPLYLLLVPFLVWIVVIGLIVDDIKERCGKKNDS